MIFRKKYTSFDVKRFYLLLITGFCLLLTAGCSERRKSDDPNNKGIPPIVIYTGIRPIAFIVAKVGGKFADVNSLVPEGKSPHSFLPSPADIDKLQRADCYFSINLALERNVILPVLSDTGVKITDISSGIERLPMSGDPRHGCDDCGGFHEDKHAIATDHELFDPHIWLDPENAIIIATNALKILCESLPARSEYFKLNYQRLVRNLQSLDSRLRKQLSPFRGETFLVYHPSFGYFAKRYGLVQKAVEIDGKSPSPRKVSQLVEIARKNNIHIIFVQPQFNQKAANAVASAIRGRVVPLNPLHYNVIENLNTIALEIRQALGNGSRDGKN